MAFFWWTTIPAVILFICFSFIGPFETSEEFTRKKRVNKIARIMVLLGYCAAWVLFISLKVIPDIKTQNRINSQIEEIYFSAVELAVQEQYSDAAALLDTVDVHAGTGRITWHDYHVLQNFCNGMVTYQTGNWETALAQIPEWDISFLTDESKDILYERRKSVLKDCRQREKEEKDRQYQIALDKAQCSTGYVGMSESFISKTRLGAPCSIDTKYPWKESPIKYYHYYYYGDYYTLTCQGGVVIRVNYYTPSRTYSSHKNDDPYHAKDYDDPEDFYEDYFDEFDGFEDAEDYFDSIHGY